MQEIVIKNQTVDNLLNQLNHQIEGNIIKDKWGQTRLSFDNPLGKGIIKSISFDFGVSLIDYDVNFSEDTSVVFLLNNVAPIEFIFVSEGTMEYKHNGNKEKLKLQRYQNIIISPLKNSKKTFYFKEGENVKVNFIQIDQKKYRKKKNSNLEYLDEVLASVFNEESDNLPFSHLGNFNLKIADEVKELHGNNEVGIIKTLGLEGRLYIVLALQLLEHHKFINDEPIPDSLSRVDIKKIHQVAQYIVDNISEHITIKKLSEQWSLSPKKLQMGFRMLYSCSVNEYMKRMKLEISRDYLKNSDYSISEIVYLIGIRSRSYFSKIFSEYYGILPTEYRAKIKGKV